MPFPNLLLGLLLSAIIAGLAYLRGSLAPSGVIGAIVVGTLIFAGGGLPWALVLIAFFVTSSALSHYKSRVKEPLAEKFQKGHRRDIAQVLANGGWGALIALTYAMSPNPLLFFAFVGAIATATADTWATEVGVLSARPPRLITTGRVVPVGTSGGVTLFGTLIAFCGAAFIGIIAALTNLEALTSSLSISNLSISNLQSLISQSLNLFISLPLSLSISQPYVLSIILVSSISGLLGSLFDSFLGATVQAIYFCDADHKETESRVHRCGRATRLLRGWRWLDNDAVNFLASVFGSVVAMLGYWVIA